MKTQNRAESGEGPNQRPFVFAISLQPRMISRDWHAVEEKLRHTIRSIRGSRNARTLVVIACHDENEEVVDAIGLPSS